MGLKAYKQKFTPHAVDLVRHLPPQIKPDIRFICEQITKQPFFGKALNNELAGYYSVRHGRYRVIYSVDEPHSTVVIEFVGQRSSVYDVFTQIVKRQKRMS